MSGFTIRRALASAVFLIALLIPAAHAQQKSEWTWKDAHGKTRTRAELDSILNQGNLRGRNDLQGALLRGAHLAGADLTAANLTGADLTDADLTNADLEGAWLSGADLTRADFRGAYLAGAYLINVHVTCVMNVANPFDAHPPCAVLIGADLTKAVMHGADLGGADLSRADLSSAGLADAYLAGAELADAKLTGATLRKADLTNANLHGVDLSNANLDYAQLCHTRLDSADLTGASLSRADLTGAQLQRAELDGAHLDNTDLIGVALSGASLKHADLNRADLACIKPASIWNCADLSLSDLREASLEGADLTGVGLKNAILSGAHLNGTDLTGADLRYARASGVDLRSVNLSNATLSGADLSGANLWNADLTNADLFETDLGDAHFEPRRVPEMRRIAAAKNLESLTYASYPDALIQLRTEFQEAGLRAQERKMTYALKRRETELSWEGCKSRELPETMIYRPKPKVRAIVWSPDSNLANCGAFILNSVFFDWTCQYGMSPGRPLSLGILVWMLCSILYFTLIHSSGEAALYRIYAPGIGENLSETPRVERILPTGKIHARGWRRILQFLRKEWLVLRASMFFSLMSAFNIGFRDINFGRWLRLLTRQEFDIKAVGWARVVAGWQSLISVFLIALWVLTYFGRPFG